MPRKTTLVLKVEITLDATVEDGFNPDDALLTGVDFAKVGIEMYDHVHNKLIRDVGTDISGVEYSTISVEEVDND